MKWGVQLMGHFWSPNLVIEVRSLDRGPVDLMDRGSPDPVTLDRQIWSLLKHPFFSQIISLRPLDPSKRGHFGPPKGVILTQNHQSQALDPLRKGVPEGVQPIRMDRGVQCTFWHFLVTFKMSVFWPLFFSQNENVKKVTFFVIVFASFIGGKMTPFLTIEKHEKRGQKRGTDFDPPS